MKDILWGMPTLIELNTIEDNVGLCKRLGLNFIELNMNLPEYQPNKIDIEKFIYLKEKNNIFYTIHLPEEFNIADFNDDIRGAYEKVFDDTVMVAKNLKSPLINMHMKLGVYFTLPTEKIFLYSKYIESYKDKIKKFASYSSERLRKLDIKLCIENTGIYDMEFIRKAVDELILHDNIFLTWDIGHDHASGNKDTRYIFENIGKLKHMHFHDAVEKNNHLPLFTGHIDIFEKISIAKKYSCSCVIETKTVEGLKESVDNLKKKAVFSG